MSGERQSGYPVMPSAVELAGRELWLGSHELQALWNRLQESLNRLASRGPAWGTDIIGQTYGPDYTQALEMVRRAMAFHAELLNAKGKEIVKGAKAFAELDDEVARSFTTQEVRSRPLKLIDPW